MSIKFVLYCIVCQESGLTTHILRKQSVIKATSPCYVKNQVQQLIITDMDFKYYLTFEMIHFITLQTYHK